MESDHFRQVVEGIDQAALLVVIDSWIGADLRARLVAEDVLQATLASAWVDRAKYEYVDPKSFRAWLLAIARNRLCDEIDHLQAAKRGGGRLLQSLDESGLAFAAPVRSTTPSRIAVARERAQHMEQALRSLPAELAFLVRGHLFEQRPMPELAAEQDIKLSTAWSRFRRGAERYVDQLRTLRRSASSPGP
jgi:RNA polymerase sigma factor (sigma-70 family)